MISSMKKNKRGQEILKLGSGKASLRKIVEPVGKQVRKYI